MASGAANSTCEAGTMTRDEKTILIQILNGLDDAVRELEADSDTCYVRENTAKQIGELEQLFAVDQTKDNTQQ